MYLTHSPRCTAPERTVLSPANLLRLAGSDSDVPAEAANWSAALGVEYSTERLQPGDIFFALPGATTHGVRFAAAALEKGASFIISDRPTERGLVVTDPAALLLKLGSTARQATGGTVIGVTGSAGKTTTKELLAGLLDAASSPGNLNTPLALACSLVRTALHEPGRDLVLELGIDHPGEMDQLLDLTRPDTGVLTTISHSHLDRLGSVATVASEKLRLIQRSEHRYVSDQALNHLETLPAGSRVYGLSAAAHERATISSSAAGRQLTLRGHSFPLLQPGSAWATNLSGALTVALDAGHDPEVLTERLKRIPASEGRLQYRNGSGGRTVLDDSYNSNPASARAALEVLRLSPGPHAAVLGDMRELGESSAQLHRELGQLSRGLDVVIAVGEHAPDVQCGNPAALTAPDTEAALRLLGRLPAGGTVLIKASRSLGFERIVRELEERP